MNYNVSELFLSFAQFSIRSLKEISSLEVTNRVENILIVPSIM